MATHITGFVVILGSPNDAAGNLSEMGYGRVRAGYEMYCRLQEGGYRLLLTGGYGQHFNTTSKPNAFYAQQLLIRMGVLPEDIVEFAESRNTVDDALQSRPIIEKYGGEQLIVVTSDFHVQRAQFVFESVFPEYALEFVGAPYLDSQNVEERERLLAHEACELASLQQRGESIVGGALSVHAWRAARSSGKS
jgi:uncharacterized SAM-binding protein YcdF (DUF218 family)